MESLLKQFFTNMQHSTFTIPTNCKMLHISNKREECTVKGTKLIILSVFFWRIDTLRLE